jgi:hypothetical protein
LPLKKASLLVSVFLFQLNVRNISSVQNQFPVSKGSLCEDSAYFSADWNIRMSSAPARFIACTPHQSPHCTGLLIPLLRVPWVHRPMAQDALRIPATAPATQLTVKEITNHSKGLNCGVAFKLVWTQDSEPIDLVIFYLSDTERPTHMHFVLSAVTREQI